MAPTSPKLSLLPVEERRDGVRRLRLVRVLGDLGPVLAERQAPQPQPKA